MKLLITGGCGFLGSNLAAHAIAIGCNVVVFDNLCRNGSEHNLSWLHSKGSFTFCQGDIRRYQDINRIVRETAPDVIFHLAGQVAMTTSIADPFLDFQINTCGSLNLLETVRCNTPDAVILYSSTNKVYGDLEQYCYRETATRYECLDKPFGFDELTPLNFSSPYGCSKGAADQYMLDYAKIYGLKTVVFRHSTVYGGRQFATFDQGWIGWFCRQAINSAQVILKEPFTISGNGKQVRDVLHIDDVIKLYFSTIHCIEAARGKAFNIGGGTVNSLSLLELFSLLEDITQTQLYYSQCPPRASDQRFFVADITKAQSVIGWQPIVDTVSGIKLMLKWVEHGI